MKRENKQINGFVTVKEVDETCILKPVKVSNLNLETGDATIHCIAFVDEETKTNLEAEISEFETNKKALVDEMAMLESNFKKAKDNKVMDNIRFIYSQKHDELKALKVPKEDPSKVATFTKNVVISDKKILKALAELL